MTPTDRYLFDLAEQGGIRVEIVTDLHPDDDGEYVHEFKTIRLRAGMGARRKRSVLAHELGHAAFGDVPSMFGPMHAKQERRAEEWGALRLINVDDYRHAEQVHHGHLGEMALDLGVMRSMVETFAGLLLRLDDKVYVQPKMGAGQWAHREEVA